MAETISVRGMTPAVEQTRQLLPPIEVDLPKKRRGLLPNVEVEPLDIGVDEDLGM